MSREDLETIEDAVGSTVSSGVYNSCQRAINKKNRFRDSTLGLSREDLETIEDAVGSTVSSGVYNSCQRAINQKTALGTLHWG